MSILSGLYHMARQGQSVRPLPPVTEAAHSPQPAMISGGGLTPTSPPQLQAVPPRAVPPVNMDHMVEYGQKAPTRMSIADRIRAFQRGHTPEGDRAVSGGFFTPTPDMFGKGVDPEDRESQQFLPQDRARYLR